MAKDSAAGIELGIYFVLKKYMLPIYMHKMIRNVKINTSVALYYEIQLHM